MKTAISVPDPTFDAASRRAHELGMSRSEFFSRAAVHYLAELEATSLTARLDAALEVNTDDETTTAVQHAGRRVLCDDQEEW